MVKVAFREACCHLASALITCTYALTKTHVHADQVSPAFRFPRTVLEGSGVSCATLPTGFSTFTMASSCLSSCLFAMVGSGMLLVSSCFAATISDGDRDSAVSSDAGCCSCIPSLWRSLPLLRWSPVSPSCSVLAGSSWPASDCVGGVLTYKDPYSEFTSSSSPIPTSSPAGPIPSGLGSA